MALAPPGQDVFSKKLQEFASEVIKEKSKVIIENAKAELEKVLRSEADMMALSVLDHYDVTSSANELIIRIRKEV